MWIQVKSKGRHESQFIQDIVKQVQNRLNPNVLYTPPYLVGIESLVKRINWWLEKDVPNNIGIAVICGIGGIGKTTIAKVVYNQNIQRFESYSFLADVRETSRECNRLVVLQRQLISDILKGKSHKIYNADNGINKIKTPNFSRLPSLEKLMLKDCIELVEVDRSIGELNMLTFLNLKDCKCLRKLPRTIGSLISLEELVLSGCSRFDDVPRELNNMKSLKRWKELVWASLPSSLVKLSLESCSLYDDAVPNDLCNLASLKSLNLSRNPIQFLPDRAKTASGRTLKCTQCKVMVRQNAQNITSTCRVAAESARPYLPENLRRLV